MITALGLTQILAWGSSYLPAVGAGLVLYGAANGIRSIVQGHVAARIFGAEGYAVRVGWLALPSLLALQLLNVFLVGALWVSSSGAAALTRG